MALLTKIALLACCLVAQSFAQQPTMDGLVTTDYTSNEAPAPERTTPWQRLDGETRAFLERTLMAQLVNKGRANTDYENVAHGNAPYVYGAWKHSHLPSSTWPQYYFDKGLKAASRRILLCIYAKLRAERLLQFIETFDRFAPEKPWPGFNVIVNVEQKDFRSYLADNDYGNWYSAARAGRWGVRSAKTGWQFHILGPQADWDERFIEIHIDSNCPGRPNKKPLKDMYLGLKHWWEDHEKASEARIADRLKAGLISQGIFPPDVDQVQIDFCTAASLLKWKTDGDYSFGHIWLKPEAKQAGWWTKSNGSHNFEKVERLPSNNSILTYKLESQYGTLYLRVTSATAMKATWHVRKENRTVELVGELDSGHIYL